MANLLNPDLQNISGTDLKNEFPNTYNSNINKIEIFLNVLEKQYNHIGAIWFGETDPSELIGGTWEKVEGKFLLGSSENNATLTTGGEATHKLTVAEMPSHTHQVLYYNSNGTQGFGYNYQNKGIWSENVSSSSGVNNAGGDTAHNNMPPYICTPMWIRTAL